MIRDGVRAAITIELTRPQIDRVVRESTNGTGVASLLRGLAGDGTLASRYEALAESPACRAHCCSGCSSSRPSPPTAARSPSAMSPAGWG